MSNDAARGQRQARVISLAAAQLPPAQQPLFATLAGEVLARLDADDLAARSDDDLLAALASLLQAGASRPPGQAQLRLVQGAPGTAAAALRHTVVEVINDDMPFLVDSTTMELNRQGLSLHLIAHPVLAVQRNAAGELLGLHSRHAAPPGAALESWMRIEVDRVIGEAAERELAGGIAGVLAEVRAAVRDWQAMRAGLHTARDELLARAAVLPEDALSESAAFLHWLAQDHFTLLGYLQHDLVAQGGDAQLHVVPGSPLGVLSLSAQQEAPSTSFAELPARARAEARSVLPLLLLTRANTRSKVHRPGYTDYLGVKRFDASGQVIGEHRFIGLFTSSAYRSRVDETPLLRGKARAIAQRAGFAPGGHLAKALVHVLETYPRDDLFQISDDDLYDTVLGILALGERQRLRLFTWRDPYERFVSCLVYVPREAYSTALRVKFQALLLAAYGGTQADFDVSLGNALLARVHFNIRVPAGQAVQVDQRALEQALAAAARRWEDGLRDALLTALGEGRGLELFKQWAAALPGDYLRKHGLSVDSQTIDLTRLGTLFHSALTDADWQIPTGHYEQENMKQTVVPNRNAIFSSIAYGYALSIAVQEDANVDFCLGVHSGDHSIYPDCRPEFYEAILKAFSIGNWDSEKVNLHLPYLHGDKLSILQDADVSIQKLGLDFDTIFRNTCTSYLPDKAGRSHGLTGSDVERIIAFHKFGRADPVGYIEPWEVVVQQALKIEKRYLEEALEKS